ncbi:MAG: hypothetical protein ACI8VE_000657 [Natrialbaceae archaeon]|jgi:hypothetical protein
MDRDRLVGAAKLLLGLGIVAVGIVTSEGIGTGLVLTATGSVLIAGIGLGQLVGILAVTGVEEERCYVIVLGVAVLLVGVLILFLP